MKTTFLVLSFSIAFATSGVAQTSTTQFLDDCRALAIGSGKGAGNCASLLDGALGAFGLLTKEFFPVSAQLGYCIEPGTTSKQAAQKIVDFADATPECVELAHFSMCMNMAFQEVYAGTC